MKCVKFKELYCHKLPQFSQKFSFSTFSNIYNLPISESSSPPLICTCVNINQLTLILWEAYSKAVQSQCGGIFGKCANSAS